MAVQEYVSSLRIAGGVVNTVVVRAAAEGIISARDITKLKLASHGGHINITKGWEMSLLNRMGYVKCKASTSGKIPQSWYGELREVFLADIAAEVVTKDIPRELIFSWDQNWSLNNPYGQLDNGKGRCQSCLHSPCR